MQSLDFVIPLKAPGLITRAVLEGIDRLYRPRSILIITDLSLWKPIDYDIKTPLRCIDESCFFGEALSKQRLQERFDRNVGPDLSWRRPFGWWYQQILKLGCHQVVKDISQPFYVVWDSDLIPLKRWDLVVDGKACTAILQREAVIQKHFNFSEVTQEYSKATLTLTGMPPLRPSVCGKEALPKSFPGESYGTFVSHHMVFNAQYVQELLNLIIDVHQSKHGQKPLEWPLIFVDLAKDHFRVSEYELYQTYCFTRRKPANRYYPYEMHGAEGRARFNGGVRKDGINILSELEKTFQLDSIKYDDIVQFVRSQIGRLFDEMPSYLQIDGV